MWFKGECAVNKQQKAIIEKSLDDTERHSRDIFYNKKTLDEMDITTVKSINESFLR